MIPGTLRIASRMSPLALVQVEEALGPLKELLPEVINWELVKMPSPGDQDLVTSLSDPSVPDDFFTRSIDECMLAGNADLSIHSAKDLPEQLADGLVDAAYLPSVDIRDALVFRKDFDPQQETLRVIGTSSPRRIEAVKTLYPEAEVKDIRGTINARLEQLDAGEYDAVIIAACALKRLGLDDRIDEYLACDPAPQQGRLAIVVRKDLKELVHRIRMLDVRQHAGMVAIIGCPPDHEAVLTDRARRYIRFANVIFADEGLPESLFNDTSANIVPVTDPVTMVSIEPCELNRLMAIESEKGHLVVRLHHEDLHRPGPPSREISFFLEWGFRMDPVTLSTMFNAPHQHWTLFTGTKPDNFIRYGPIIEWPLIELEPNPLDERINLLEQNMDGIDGIIFPSRFAVEYFMEAFQELENCSLKEMKLLAVGPATAEALKEHGIEPDLNPVNFRGIEALKKLLGEAHRGTYLYPCSTASPIEERVKSAIEAGLTLRPCAMYTNKSLHYSTYPDLPVDRVIFTSPSTVYAYFDNYPDETDADRIWMAIGPSTRRALQQYALQGDIMELPS